MGRDERVKQAQMQLGKFNVHVKVTYKDNKVEEWDCKSYTPGPTAMGLDIELPDGLPKLVIVVVDACKKIEVTHQESTN